jgi:hypothetical protein
MNNFKLIQVQLIKVKETVKSAAHRHDLCFPPQSVQPKVSKAKNEWLLELKQVKNILLHF